MTAMKPCVSISGNLNKSAKQPMKIAVANVCRIQCKQGSNVAQTTSIFLVFKLASDIEELKFFKKFHSGTKSTIYIFFNCQLNWPEIGLKRSIWPAAGS